MPNRRIYRPPPLIHRVRLVDPEAVTATRDRYGRITESEGAEGVQVWAGRRDRSPDQLLEEEAVIHSITTVWVIRRRSGVPANVEVHFDGEVWRSVGPPVIRGGPDWGIRQLFFEIHAELRQ